MRRVLLAASLAMAVAGAAVLIVRLPQHPEPPSPLQNPRAVFDEALRRHDYRRAYGLTDLSLLKIVGGSSAVTLAHFTAFVKAHGVGGWAVVQGLVHVPTTNLHATATTGPLPSLSVDGVGVSLRAQRVKAGRVAAAAWRYTYALVVISGAHSLTVGSGPVTASRSLTGVFRGGAASVDISLAAGAAGNNRAAAALRSVVGTCPDDLCVFTPCSGGGPEIVVDAWGIGTPPIVARDLVGDRVIAPMPLNGWSMAITFLDQGQPPRLSGKEQTKQVRARYVFGFVGSGKPTLLDRCWVTDH
jgi:hypothetical protein